MDLDGVHVRDADRLDPPVDVLGFDHGVFARFGRDVEFDLGVGFGEGGEVVRMLMPFGSRNL